MKYAPLVYIETSVFGFFPDELPHNRIHANEWAMRRVNGVNLDEGHPMISTRTPEEVIRYET